jgi:hypothetical protein
MRRTDMSNTRIAALAGTVGLALCAYSPAARAADHRDGAAVKTDPQTDINDVYAWMSADGSKVNLIMTVFPVADTMSKFSTTAKYVFHLNSSAGYMMPQMETRLICTFDAAQMISCWLTRGTETLEYMTGDASATTGLASMSGKLTVFAGLRDDPFFFNLAGFNAVAQTVSIAKSGLMLDPAGCPNLDMGTADALVGQLSMKPGGGTAENFFAGLNTLTIAVQVDKALVTPGGAVLGVWASTNR